MVGALGVNQRLLFTSVFFLGSCLAGLGGALQLPREAVNLHMDLSIIAEAFVVVVVGGLGSVSGRLPGGGADRRDARFRHPDFSADHAGSGVPGHGGGAGRAAAWAAGPRRRPGRSSGAAREPCCLPATPGGRTGSALALLAALAVAPLLARRLCAVGLLTELADPDAVRRQPAFHHGAGRDGVASAMRPISASAPMARRWRRKWLARADGGGAAARAVRWPGWSALRVRLVLRAAFGRVSGDADAGLRADRLVGGLPVGRADRRRQRHPGRVAGGLGGVEDRLLLPHAGALRRRDAAAARIIFSPFGYALRAGRDCRCGRRPSASTSSASVGGLRRLPARRRASPVGSTPMPRAASSRPPGISAASTRC